MASHRMSVSMKSAVVLNKQSSNELEKTVRNLKKETKNRLCHINNEKDTVLETEHEYYTSLGRRNISSEATRNRKTSREELRGIKSRIVQGKLPPISTKSQLLSGDPLSVSSFPEIINRGPKMESLNPKQKHGAIRKISLPARTSMPNNTTHFRKLSGENPLSKDLQDTQKSAVRRKISDSRFLRPCDRKERKGSGTCSPTSDREYISVRRSSSLSDLDYAIKKLKDCRYLRLGVSRESVCSDKRDTEH